MLENVTLAELIQTNKPSEFYLLQELAAIQLEFSNHNAATMFHFYVVYSF